MRMEDLTYLIAPFTGTGTAWVRRGRRKTLKKPERTSPLRRFIILTYQTTNLNLLLSFYPLHIAYEAKTILLLFVDANLDKYPTPSKKTFDFLARKPKNKTEQKKIVFTSRFHLI